MCHDGVGAYHLHPMHEQHVALAPMLHSAAKLSELRTFVSTHYFRQMRLEIAYAAWGMCDVASM